MYLLQRHKYHLEHHLFDIDLTLLQIADRKIVLHSNLYCDIVVYLYLGCEQ